MNHAERVTIVEVGPRDGLQNEAQTIPTAVKVELINRLASSGLPVVEATSFVSPKWVPQLADAKQVLEQIERQPGVRYPVLVPNQTGFERALDCAVEEIAIFTAASESFNQRNINCSIAESIKRFQPLAASAIDQGIRVRGYISCVAGCPYEGPIKPAQVAAVCEQLMDLGCAEISLGDTIGVGTAKHIKQMLNAVQQVVPTERLASHYHDTYGQALANLLVSLEQGIRTIDASVAGLGGCPYAKGATGNVATEDVIYLLEGLGLETGVDLDALADTGAWISTRLQRNNQSRAGSAILNKRA